MRERGFHKEIGRNREGYKRERQRDRQRETDIHRQIYREESEGIEQRVIAREIERRRNIEAEVHAS